MGPYLDINHRQGLFGSAVVSGHSVDRLRYVVQHQVQIHFIFLLKSGEQHGNYQTLTNTSRIQSIFNAAIRRKICSFFHWRFKQGIHCARLFPRKCTTVRQPKTAATDSDVISSFSDEAGVVRVQLCTFHSRGLTVRLCVCVCGCGQRVFDHAVILGLPSILSSGSLGVCTAHPEKE